MGATAEFLAMLDMPLVQELQPLAKLGLGAWSIAVMGAGLQHTLLAAIL
jgi:hypothetical protein